MEIWIVSAILIVSLYLLISEKLPMDVSAIGIIALLSVSGVLSPVEAVSGFANPALITVAAMFLISSGMIRTGAVEILGDRVVSLARGRAGWAIALVFLIVALSSAFLNNTPIVVLFIPLIMSMCCRFNLSPSKYLIPLSYASILAGTCTLIGTSTNIIVSDLSAGYGYGAIGMFELSKAGIPIAAAGLCFIWLAAPKLLPNMANPACELEKGEHRKYLAQLKIPKNAQLIGRDLDGLFRGKHPTVEIIELIRYDHIYYPGRDDVRISGDDILLVKGPAKDIVQVIQEGGMDLSHSEKTLHLTGEGEEKIIVELIVPPQSRLRGEKLVDARFFRDPDFHIIAIQRSGLNYTEREIQDVRLKVGDVILVQVPWEKLPEFRQNSDFMIMEDIHHRIPHKAKARYAGLIFISVVSLASLGVLNIMTCAIAGTFLMFITGCLQVRDAYRALQGNVLMLIAGTIALGSALDKTGASRLYADIVLKILDGFSPVVILSAFILITSISTQLLSNNATAVLILPVAISAALELGANPKSFVIAVCFGASACFATPMGYQTNLLVYGPGGYRFSDYLKMGLPLNALVLIMGCLLIPVFWPL